VQRLTGKSVLELTGRGAGVVVRRGGDGILELPGAWVPPVDAVPPLQPNGVEGRAVPVFGRLQASGSARGVQSTRGRG